MPRTYRVAIIGSTGHGDYGHGIDTVWKEIPEAVVVAVADEDETGRAKAVARSGAKTAYADYRAMLEAEKPEIVAIGPRWIDRHHEFALACVERGRHVFMEKPFCRTLEEADAIVRACEMTHAKLALAHQTRYCPIIPVVQKMIADGKLGTLLELRARGKEDQRGGCEDFWVLGSHMLNLMTAFAGTPQSCFAQLTTKGRPVTRMDIAPGPEGLGPLAGDAVSAQYQFADGITGFFGSRRSQGGNPARFALQILGSKGVVEYLSGYLPAVHFLADPGWSPGRSGAAWQKVTSAGVDQPESLPGGNERGNVVAVNDLISAIENDRQPLCSASDGRTTIEMIAGAFESHRLGKPVSFPLENRKHPLAMLS
ncbi:MAG: Gfo/Idh/MocA family oxidoreductase [Planctomycetaceae bacterium]|nr:Gfo/Idh/MocA family oxidoreductase [Planctomycetaceae bacterium]